MASVDVIRARRGRYTLPVWLRGVIRIMIRTQTPAVRNRGSRMLMASRNGDLRDIMCHKVTRQGRHVLPDGRAVTFCSFFTELFPDLKCDMLSCKTTFDVKMRHCTFIIGKE